MATVVAFLEILVLVVVVVALVLEFPHILQPLAYGMPVCVVERVGIKAIGVVKRVEQPSVLLRDLRVAAGKLALLSQLLRRVTLLLLVSIPPAEAPL